MSRRLVHVLTVADSLIFIDTLVQRARDEGYDVTVITSPDERLDAFGRRLGVRTFGVEMPRRVSPAGDWVALTQLRALMERIRPDIVHAGTPKGGLLGTLAARSLRVPVRLFQLRGLASATASGLLKGVLETTERVSCRAATRVVCQSHSLRAQALELGIVEAERSEVVLDGSNGVDTEARFNPDRHAEAGFALRRSRGIEDDEVVFAFVGRLVRDKGIPELSEAFTRLAGQGLKVRLLIAGPFEPRDPVPAEVRARLESDPRIHLLGAVSEPAPVYSAADVVVLPSHREGFPNVPLEAAAMGKPVITTRVPGCIDSIEAGRTGVLVGVGEVAALAEAMRRYAREPALREAHGQAGRARAVSRFSRTAVADAFLRLYARELTGN